MKKNKLEILLVFAGATFFNILFWQEKMGLNVLLFTLYAIASVFWKARHLRYSKPVIVTAAGTILLAILIVFNNSALSKIIYFFSLLTFAGFCKETEIKALWHALLAAIWSAWKVPVRLFDSLTNHSGKGIQRLKPFLRHLQLSFIPFLILIAFYFIYYLGNNAFSQLSDSFWFGISDWVYSNFSFERALFFVLAVLISGVLILSIRFDYFRHKRKGQVKYLTRTKQALPIYLSGMIALKKEFQKALLTIFSLNLLLFVVNAIDIIHVWVGYDASEISSFKDYVHEGTYMLILSILMAMVVVLFFFRKNLNFYPASPILKAATYVWIAQNGILALSLLIRNMRYIDYHGLAYKRIGVLVFLLMVLIGLSTMFLKVRERHSNFYLWHKNAWALYFVMIFCCFINWDVLITKYNLNLQIKSEIDYEFLIFSVSDKNIYLLEEHLENAILPTRNAELIRQSFERKKQRFITGQKHYTVLSWNYPDAKNRKQAQRE